jgi:hypothetical protein
MQACAHVSGRDWKSVIGGRGPQQSSQGVRAAAGVDDDDHTVALRQPQPFLG